MANTTTGWSPLGGRKIKVDAGHYADLEGQVAAIRKSSAVIEFDLDGTIRAANDNFLNAMGYRLDEIQGRHHSMFVEPGVRESAEYRQFWQKLGRGEFEAGQFKRLAKGGREVWIEASYNPILNADGRPYKVVKFASDVTAQVQRSQQIQQAVAQSQDAIHAAGSGDLSKRVDTSQAAGDALKMGTAINMLLGGMSEAFTEIAQVISRATEGDLSSRVPTGSKRGEIRQLSESVNLLMETFCGIVNSVTSASGEVMRGADEISQGNVNLSQRTEQQSSSLEETASSMEEMTSTVKQNADNAGQANQLAVAARDQAEKGGSVVGQAVTAMGKINEASKKIADIIGVIDEIAFQTNLLALNAAVEAARAGEQGRGFAVVATEVRSLAGRSATAAKEIKELIQDSVQKVEDGSSLVTQSGQTLDQIVTSVKKVSDIVAEIAAASREQSAGIEQVNKAVMQMDEMTQQNAALVEEATAASQSMAGQARQLSGLMDRYKTGESRSDSSHTAPRKVAAVPAVASRPSVRPVASKKPQAVRSVASAGGSGSAAPARSSGSAKAPASDTEWQEF